MSAVRCTPFTYMSTHAQRRLQERTKMSAYEIASLLDKGRYVDIGRKPGFHRHHLVFYSKKDDCCFVAIRDENSGTVVTVLPLNYQANLAWPVRAEDESYARTLATRGPSARTLHEKGSAKKKPKRFHVGAQYMDSQGDRHTQFLASFPSGLYRGDHEVLLQDIGVQERLDSALSSACVNPRAILSLVVRLGVDVVAEIDLGL